MSEAVTTDVRLDEPLYPILERTEAVKAVDEVHITRFMYSQGVTKRELFAAMAMQGALGGTPGSHLAFEQLARESVMHADALLKELAK